MVPSPTQPGASGAVQGGPIPVAQPPAGVPSGTRTPISPSRRSEKGATYRSGTRMTAPRPWSSGPSRPHLAGSVELPMPFVAPVDRVANKKRKTTSPLMPHQSETRPTSNTLGACPESIKGEVQELHHPSPGKHFRIAPRAIFSAVAGNGLYQHGTGS